ncbi:hypothetical protein TIFTF001_022491 [Ficus carica]|uniref:Uncharacterized protein n=1 Tax=Ficus carica TaxID=3494 RepID=A0AA88DBR3_FICCA|nr:hypothetical protein TIFTF001_022491 [Ficus carica]
MGEGGEAGLGDLDDSNAEGGVWVAWICSWGSCRRGLGIDSTVARGGLGCADLDLGIPSQGSGSGRGSHRQ